MDSKYKVKSIFKQIINWIALDICKEVIIQAWVLYHQEFKIETVSIAI